MRRRSGESNTMHHVDELVARGFSEAVSGLVRRPWGRSRSMATLWGPRGAPKERQEGCKRALRKLREGPERAQRGGQEDPQMYELRPR